MAINTPIKAAKAQFPNSSTPPPSLWSPWFHPRMTELASRVNDYFLKHWEFPDDKSRTAFASAGYCNLICAMYPLARDDRIEMACRLITILYLIDDEFDRMSFEEGQAYNDRLIPICRGDVPPRREVPVEFIMHDLWEEMRSHDRQLADDLLEPTFVLLRAQPDPSLKKNISSGLGPYLRFREKHVGKAIASALMRFSTDIRLSAPELQAVALVESNSSNHISVVNDIYSWEKEVRGAETLHAEGATICSSVRVLAEESQLGVEATKRVLWCMVREWEHNHEELCARILESDGVVSDDIKLYIKALEHQMSGMEEWCKVSTRYN